MCWAFTHPNKAAALSEFRFASSKVKSGLEMACEIKDDNHFKEFIHI